MTATTQSVVGTQPTTTTSDGMPTGPELREAFYKLLNINEYDSFLPTARRLADRLLASSRAFEQAHHDDPQFWHDRFFPYTREAFEIRLTEIYDDLAAQSILPYNPEDDDTFKTYDDVVERIRQFAPFNQLDGTWIRNVAQGGPLDVVRSLLFSIWMDEAGDGRPEWNHCNLYTNLLRSVAVYLPSVQDLEYANDPNFLDSAFVQPVLMLVLSEFTEDYLPEIIGYTLNIEWQVLSLWPTVKLLKYFKIDPHFYTLHIGIDNASEGHGARAKAAIHDYLDDIRANQGEAAMQEIWARIWNGFVAADILGTLGQDLQHKLRDKPSLKQQTIDMVNRKAPFASLNHGNVPELTNSQGQTKPLNEWFDDPEGLLDALVHSGWLLPGEPDQSPFFQKLSFQGPMFRVFTTEEIKLWHDYTRSLAAPSQNTPPDDSSPDRVQPTPPAVPSATAMLDIVQKIAPIAQQIPLHDEHYLTGPDPQQPGQTITKSVLWWVGQTAESLMQALRHPDSHMVTPGQPDQSAFYTFWIAPDGGPMGNVFAMASGIEGYATRRDVVAQWILDHCPLPDTAASAPASRTSGDKIAAIIRSYDRRASSPQGTSSNGTVRSLFESDKTPEQIMQALISTQNTPRYITPGDAQSHFLTQEIGPGGSMEGVFTPEEIAAFQEWVGDNCPMPLHQPKVRLWLHTPVSLRQTVPGAVMQGPGSVH